MRVAGMSRCRSMAGRTSEDCPGSRARISLAHDLVLNSLKTFMFHCFEIDTFFNLAKQNLYLYQFECLFKSVAVFAKTIS